MSILDGIKSLISKLSNMTSKVLAKDYLAKEAMTTIDGLKDCATTIQDLNSSFDTSVLDQVLRNDPQYKKFYKLLHGYILTEESKKPLSAIGALVNLYITELEYLVKHAVKTTTLNKSAAISEIKLSQTAFLGVVEAGMLVERFTKAFIFKSYLAYGSYSVTNGVDTKAAIDKFRKSFPWFYKVVEEHTDFIAGQINSYCNRLKAVSFVDRIINFFAGEAYDPVLFDSENQPNTSYLSILENSPDIAEMSIFGLPSLNLFRHGANIYINWQHSRMLQKEYEKKWMENYKLTLEMKKRDMDVESAEYKKMEKVIGSYEDMIADATADIEEYRNS